jgi:hypothetical protein
MVAIPLWLPGLNGDVTAKGLTFTSNQDTSDVLDLVDSHLNGALALHLEAQKGRFGVFTDFMYVSMAAERDTRLGTTIGADFDGFIGEIGPLYTVYSASHLGKLRTPVRLDAIGGLRVTSLKVNVETENLGSAEQSKTLYDPFIGMRGEVGLLHWLSLKGRGDVGGLDMIEGESCQFTWNASAAASFHLARWCSIDTGYRWLHYDFEQGSGNDQFGIDATLHGPYVEFAFKF